MKKKILIISAVALGALLIVGIFARSVSKNNLSRNSGISAPLGSGVPSNPLYLEKSADQSLAEEASQDTAQADKKIIKNGSLAIKVSKADEAAEDISQIAKNNGGDVLSSNFYQTSSNIKSGTVTIKVPVKNFEKAFEEIKKVASLVTRESTNSQDVTEQYIDLQSRLKNKQAEEQSFVNILGRSGTISDVLNVTREISRVRGEIEVLQGKIKYMDSQTDMATISVNLSEDSEITITDSWRPLRMIKDTVNSLLKDVQKFINFAIVLVIRVIPVLALYLLLVLMLFLIGRKIYRRIKAKKSGEDVIISK